MRLGFFFVAAKSLSANKSILLLRVACQPQRTTDALRSQSKSAGNAQKRLVSEKQQRRPSQRAADEQHQPFSCLE
jgi:hypothetical protein